MKLKIFVDDSGQLGVNYTRRPARRTDRQPNETFVAGNKRRQKAMKKRRRKSCMGGGKGNIVRAKAIAMQTENKTNFSTRSCLRADLNFGPLLRIGNQSWPKITNYKIKFNKLTIARIARAHCSFCHIAPICVPVCGFAVILRRLFARFVCLIT